MTRDSIHISMSEPLRRAQVRPRLQALADATGLPVALVAARALTIGIGPIESDLRLMFPAPAALIPPTVTSASDTASTAGPPSATASDNAPSSSPVLPDAIPSITAVRTETPGTAAALDAVSITPAVCEETPSTTKTCDKPSGEVAQTADTQHAPIACTVEQRVTPVALASAETEQPPPAPKPEQPTAPTMVQTEFAPGADLLRRVSSADAARALKITLVAFYSHLHRNRDLKRYSQIVGRAAMWDMKGLRAAWSK